MHSGQACLSDWPKADTERHPILPMDQTTGVVRRGELSKELEKGAREGAVTRPTSGEGPQVTARFRCEGGRESAVIGHGHDGAGGSLIRACHGTGKLAELEGCGRHRLHKRYWGGRL